MLSEDHNNCHTGVLYAGVKDKAEAGGQALPLLVFWPVFSLGGKEAQAGKMLKTCKHEKFRTGFLSFCKILSQNKASLIQAMVSCNEYSSLCSNLLLFLDN